MSSGIYVHISWVERHSQVDGKTGSYRNGLTAYLKAFVDRFISESGLTWDLKYTGRRRRKGETERTLEEPCALVCKHGDKEIFEIHWTMDWGGLRIMVDTPYMNIPPKHPDWPAPTYGICGNRPLNPSLAQNYVTAAHYRRKKPKYKQQGLKLAKQIHCNWKSTLS